MNLKVARLLVIVALLLASCGSQALDASESTEVALASSTATSGSRTRMPLPSAPPTDTTLPTPTPRPSSTPTPTEVPTASHTPSPPPSPASTDTPPPTDTPVPLPTPTAPPPTSTPLPPTDTPLPPTEPSPTPEPTQPPPGDVVISNIFYDGVVARVESDEYAEITNQGGSPVNLAGWRLNADDPGQDFFFPDFVIQPGQSCRVYTNEIHSEYCGFSFGSGQALWKNSGECGHLFDANGVEVSQYCY